MNARTFQSLIFVSLLLSLVGCGNDESDTKSNFDGIWVSKSIQTTGCSDEGDNKTLACDLACTTLTIQNGAYTKVDTSEEGVTSTTEGTITVSREDFIICESADNCNRWAFSFDGTTLNLSLIDDVDGCVLMESYTEV